MAHDRGQKLLWSRLVQTIVRLFCHENVVVVSADAYQYLENISKLEINTQPLLQLQIKHTDFFNLINAAIDPTRSNLVP